MMQSDFSAFDLPADIQADGFGIAENPVLGANALKTTGRLGLGC